MFTLLYIIFNFSLYNPYPDNNELQKERFIQFDAVVLKLCAYIQHFGDSSLFIGIENIDVHE